MNKLKIIEWCQIPKMTLPNSFKILLMTQTSHVEYICFASKMIHNNFFDAQKSPFFNCQHRDVNNYSISMLIFLKKGEKSIDMSI